MTAFAGERPVGVGERGDEPDRDATGLPAHP